MYSSTVLETLDLAYRHRCLWAALQGAPTAGAVAARRAFDDAEAAWEAALEGAPSPALDDHADLCALTAIRSVVRP